MESAELDKGKRVRHCFPRKEVYHRFIHSENYAYSPANRHQISCKGNYLVIGDIGKKSTIIDIEEMWFYNSNRMIAIIHRNLKRIIINRKYDYYYYELRNAIPDDYTIYYTDETFSDKNILLDTEKCLRTYSKFLIEKLVETSLQPYYSILYNNNKKTLHCNINIEERKYGYYKTILDFIKINKIKKYSFYKECFNEKYKLRIYTTSWRFIIKEIKLPTLQQIVNNTIFNKKEKLLFEQKYFWTKYCYGRSIPFKDVKYYWNTEIISQKMCVYFNKHNIYWLDNYKDETCITWNDYIIRSYEIEEKHHAKYIQENIERSNKNRKEAKEKAAAIVNQEDAILAWRNGTRIRDCKIDFKEFVPPHRRGQYGSWRTSYIYVGNFSFKNTQLKLVGENVVTSRNASVPLSSAIATFHLFDSCCRTYDATGKDRFTFPNRFNVGIYNLRDIQYIEKFADNGEKLGYKSWLIRIGCHNLWIDDIMNFIKYYHLENKFLSNNLN